MLSVIRRYYIEIAERTELGFGTEKFLRLTLHCVVIEFEYLRKLRYFPLKHQFKLLTLPIFLPFRHDSRQPYESCKPIVRLMKIRHTLFTTCLWFVCNSRNVLFSDPIGGPDRSISPRVYICVRTISFQLKFNDLSPGYWHDGIQPNLDINDLRKGCLIVLLPSIIVVKFSQGNERWRGKS